MVAEARPKTDAVVMDNGDLISCEINELSHGLLDVSTDVMGTVKLEWVHIKKINSAFTFQVELVDGRILIGPLATGVEQGAKLKIGEESVPFNQVARLASIEKEILSRLNGSASIGYSYTKSSDSQQISAAVDLSYRSPQTHANFNFSSISVDDTSGEHDREDLNFTYRRPRPSRWYGAGVFQSQRNEDLGIELRVSAGGGIGRYLSQATDREIAVTGGLIATREWDIGIEDSTDELEGFIELNGNYYVYDAPKVSFGSSLILYPGLTNWGSVRADLDLTLRWEFIKDLSFQLQLYGSYDNQPPEDTDSVKSDYGIVTSLVYEF
jgi:hypothetical protein